MTTSTAVKQPLLTKQDAQVIILELMVRGASRLFDERCEDDPHLAPDNLAILRRARDVQIERLKENLRYAKKVAE